LQNYIKKNATILKSRLRGYFAVCGNMMQPVGPEQTKTFIDNHLALLAGVSNLPSQVFRGRITFGLMDRMYVNRWRDEDAGI
jgi:hypothetical protein